MRTLAALAVAALTLPALADLAPVDYSNLPVYQATQTSAVPVGTDLTTRDENAVYSNMDPGANGYVSYDPATGVIGVDDYDSTLDADITLTELQFVGGVTNPDEILFFVFYDFDTQEMADGFGVQLSDGGNYIWTITIGDEVIVPDHGILQISADEDTGSTGQWFLGDAGPTIGTEDPMMFGTGDGAFSQNFELSGVPEPASLALLALGALASLRRR